MHLFGKRRAPRPALSGVGVRVRRLRVVGGLEFVRWVPLLKFAAVMASMACFELVAFIRMSLAMRGLVAWKEHWAKALLETSWMGMSLFLGFAIAWAIGFEHVVRFAWRLRPPLRHYSRERRSALRWFKWILAAWFVVIAALIAWLCTSLDRGLLLLATLGAWWLPWIGLMSIVLGWTFRRGTRVVCRRCDYPMGSWRGAPTRCPECGNEWKQAWRACLGRREKHRGFLLAGAAMVVDSGGAMYWVVGEAIR